MRVLVTGSDGYIGAILGPDLMKRGFDVVGCDISPSAVAATTISRRDPTTITTGGR